MYADIAKVMSDRGFIVTAQGCRHKYNKLFDRYKRVKDHNSQTGNIVASFLLQQHLIVAKRFLQIYLCLMLDMLSYKYLQ